MGVLGCKTLLPILVEPFVGHCNKPPEGDEMGFSIPELLIPSVGGNEMLENGFTLK